MGVAEMVGQQNLTDLVVSRSATHRKPPTGLEIEPEIDGIQEQVLATPLACSTVQRARQRPRAASLRPFPPTKEIEADPEFSLKPSRSKPASARSRNVKGGPSRHRGVVWHKSNCKWEARIYENGRQKFLGYHLDEDEAAMAYDDYAVKLHGTAARLNFPHRYEHILGPLLPAQPRQLPARSAGVKKSRSPRSAATSSRSRSRHSRPAAPPSPHTPKESDPVFTRQHWHPKHQPPSPADSTSGSPLHAGAAAQLQQAKRAGHGEAPLSLGVTDPGGGRAGQGKVHAAPWPRGYTAPPVKGSSKFRGVSWNSSCGKWRAQVWQGSEVHHLGYFREEEDAARAYDEAAVQIRGPAAATNFAVVEAGEGSHMDWSPGRCSSPPSGQDAELAALVLSQLAADVEGGERWRWEAEIAGESWQSAPTAPAGAGHPSHAPLKLSATTVTTRRGGFPPSKAPLSLHEPSAGHHSPRNNPVPQIEHVEHAAHGRDCTATGLPLPQQPCPLPLFVGPSPAPSPSPADTPSVGRTLPAAATPASDAEAPVSELEDPQGGRGTPCADPPPSKYRGASGYMGVSWDKRKQKWFSQIQQHGRRHFLGYFEEEGEAGRAYDRAAVRLYGSQAQLNFPSECASLPWAKGGGRMEGFGCSLERVQGAGGALQEAARVTQELLQAASTAGRAGAAGTAAACQLADVAEQGGRHLRRLSLVSRPGEGRGWEGGGLPSCSHSMLSVPDYRELLGQLSAAARCPAPLTPTAPLTLPRQHAAQHDQQGHTVASAGSSGSSGYACHDHHPSTSLPPPQLTTHFVPAQQPTSPPITGSFPEAVQGTSGGKGGGWEGGLHPLTLAIAEAHQTSPRGVMLQT